MTQSQAAVQSQTSTQAQNLIPVHESRVTVLAQISCEQLNPHESLVMQRPALKHSSRDPIRTIGSRGPISVQISLFEGPEPTVIFS